MNPDIFVYTGLYFSDARPQPALQLLNIPLKYSDFEQQRITTEQQNMITEQQNMITKQQNMITKQQIRKTEQQIRKIEQRETPGLFLCVLTIILPVRHCSEDGMLRFYHQMTAF